MYERLYVFAEDFGLALQFAQYLLKKGWHSAPYERRGRIYLQQAAFTTSVVVSYSRPFTRGKGWPQFPSELWPYGPEKMQVHKLVLILRRQVYAHSDSSRHSIRPFQVGEHRIEVVGTPFLRLCASECAAIVGMINSIQGLLGPKLNRLRQEVQCESGT